MRAASLPRWCLAPPASRLGTAYLHCPEATISPPHRARLRDAAEHPTVVTNVMTGRPARGFVNRVMHELGPMSGSRRHSRSLPPRSRRWRRKRRRRASSRSLWAGQAAALGTELPARELTLKLAREAQDLLRRLGGSAALRCGMRLCYSRAAVFREIHVRRRATVRRIAHLARIAVAEDEVEHLRSELNAMLAFVEQLSEVDVTGVEPMTSVTPMAMKMRNDVVTDGGIAEDIVRTRRRRTTTIFLVPKVVE